MGKYYLTLLPELALHKSPTKGLNFFKLLDKDDKLMQHSYLILLKKSLNIIVARRWDSKSSQSGSLRLLCVDLNSILSKTSFVIAEARSFGQKPEKVPTG